MNKNYQTTPEQESLAHYDKLSKRFDRSVDGFLSSFFRRFIAKNLSLEEGAAVLDVGCANGSLLSALNEKTKIKGTGIDISPLMIKTAREKYPEFDFISGTAQKLPFQEASFDLAICSASFHHFPDPDGFLKEIKKVLKSEGRLVIAEIRIPFVTGLYNATVTKYSHEGDVKVYPPEELLEIFARNQWKVDRQKISRQVQYYELSIK